MNDRGSGPCNFADLPLGRSAMLQNSPPPRKICNIADLPPWEDLKYCRTPPFITDLPRGEVLQYCRPSPFQLKSGFIFQKHTYIHVYVVLRDKPPLLSLQMQIRHSMNLNKHINYSITFKAANFIKSFYKPRNLRQFHMKVNFESVKENVFNCK